MSATNAAQPRFKVGDRVRYVDGTYPFGKHYRATPTEGRIISGPDEVGEYVIHFEEWGKSRFGWEMDGKHGHWYLQDSQIEMLSLPAAKFQVQYVDDFDCEFDTQEDAEEEARKRAQQGDKVAVFKIVATAEPVAVNFKRFA